MLNAMEQQLQQAHKEVTCSSGDSFLIGASVDDDGSVNQPADTSCRRPSDAGMVRNPPLLHNNLGSMWACRLCASTGTSAPNATGHRQCCLNMLWLQT